MQARIAANAPCCVAGVTTDQGLPLSVFIVVIEWYCVLNSLVHNGRVSARDTADAPRDTGEAVSAAGRLSRYPRCASSAPAAPRRLPASETPPAPCPAASALRGPCGPAGGRVETSGAAGAQPVVVSAAW